MRTAQGLIVGGRGHFDLGQRRMWDSRPRLSWAILHSRGRLSWAILHSRGRLCYMVLLRKAIDTSCPL